MHNQGAIADSAFQDCSLLNSITLGDGIASIGQYAFDNCKKLQSVIIPNSVKTLGSYAFHGCSGIISAKIGTGITAINIDTFNGCTSLTDIQVGSNVSTINSYAFYNCSALPKILIPQSVTNIKNYVFSRCTSLKEVTMEDRNTDDTALTLGSNDYSPLFADCPLDKVYIGRNISYSTGSYYGYSPFYRNTSLRSVTITDKETEISPNEFYGCTNLKNVSIGDGVETIGDWAFSGCSSLDYFGFGSSVKSIGKEAFSDCTAMTKIVSKAATPPTCGSQALDDINKWTCTLFVPTGATATYQAADQWKEFFFISEGEGGEIPPIDPETPQCETPTISYQNGTLTFASATESVDYQYTIKDTDIKSGSGDEVLLAVTYTISVYATKSGYDNSEIATATLCWIDQQPQTEGITNDIANIPARALLIKNDGGQLIVEGAEDGEQISVYNTNGMQAGSATSHAGKATVSTTLQKGSVAIVKVGSRTFKIAM